MKAEENSSFVLVELFTSQGCSSCPPADRYLNELTQRAREKNSAVYTLSWHVDYWDYLGWKDRYSDLRYTQRQRDYARVWSLSSVYTPQMVVNGRYQFGGYRQDLAEKYIKEELAKESEVAIVLAGSECKEGKCSFRCGIAGLVEGQKLYVVLVEDKAVTNILGGENGGKRLEYDHTVRDFRLIDEIKPSQNISFDLPEDLPAQQALAIAFLQDAESKEVNAVASIEF